MSAILAVFNRNKEPIKPGLLEQMLAEQPAHAVDGEDTLVDGPAGLGHQHFWITPEEQGERQPLEFAAAGLVLVADVRLDNRPELAQALGLEPTVAATLSDSHLIGLAYQRWGAACVDHLLGDFAFIVWDRKKQHLFAARDPLGTRGLSYYVDRDVLVAATEISHILAHPAVQPRINEVRVAQFLNLMIDEEEKSFYHEVFYLPPAHCLLVTESSVHKWRYWELDPERRIRYASDADYAEHLYELLARAVRDRLRAVGRVGISLSGGLDSSTLAAVLAHEAGAERQPLRSFSYAFDELISCDERKYIQQTVNRYGYEATYLPCDDLWTLRDLEQWPLLRDFVAFDAYAWLPEAVIQAANKTGCRLLFAGYYGEAIFLGSRFWLHSLLSARQFADLFRILRSSSGAIRWRRLLVDDGLYRYTPRWVKETVKQATGRTDLSMHPALHPSLVQRIMMADSNGSVPTNNIDSRPAAAIRRSVYPGSFDQGWAAIRHRYASRGVEPVMPYWDRRLVEFLVAIPADQLGLPGVDRRIVRNAISPHLPPAVAQRPPRTVFIPLMKRGLLERETAVVRELIRAPRIVKDGFVRREWLEHTYAKLPEWHQKDVTRFWCCLCLELWFRAFW